MGERPGIAGPFTLRRHQAEALAALEEAWSAGRRRAWVVLPPGAGKTLVGLETGRRMLATGEVEHVVVLGPNTAIQAQWLEDGEVLGLDTSDTRDLAGRLTALTYQALAVFDPDAEVDDDGAEESLIARLHENGRSLVGALRDAGPLLLVLDECHHLLEVWGRLLEEVLAELPEAWVLGLTATPPETLTRAQADLVEELFGRSVYATSIPAVVREGDLAPFAELAWLTEPTGHERRWLAEEADRFHELVHQLTDPDFGSVSFLRWCDRRFVEPVGDRLTWAELSNAEPELGTAALRLHHAGLLALPDGARVREEHRREPTAEDWMALLEDWLLHGLRTEDEDARVAEAVRRALPSVGYVWTRRGIRRGRTPVDRVLARSVAKTHAAVEIVGHEHRALGDRLRMLVLCDHERASATLPARLDGVIDAQAGSATRTLDSLLEDPGTAPLSPMLVTGRTVAAAPEALDDLVRAVARSDPGLASRLEVVAGEGKAARLEGPWTSRTWVGHVTRFFEDGGSQVLVGTRGLLGEGWDARRVSGLVDLTAATTTTAVVQTRGRALRVDPAWPDKVALTWTVVCVAGEHPRGDQDWRRLVRKHTGFYGIDQDGEVVDGVAHVDPLFSPYAPPERDRFDAVNARMVVRSQDRDRVRAGWRVGEPYEDAVVRTVRILPGRATALEEQDEARAPAPVVAQRSALDLRRVRRPGWGAGGASWWGVAGLVALVVAVLVESPWPGLAAALLLLVGAAVRGRALAAFGEEVLAEVARPPSVARVAHAVADGLHGAGLVERGSESVRLDLDTDGEYRCHLADVPEHQSEVFATALDEAVSPVLEPRYLVPRHVVVPDGSPREALRAAYGRVEAAHVAWHAVPAVLGVNAGRAAAYARAWDHWVGGGDPLYTGNPQGAGVLAANRGSDPFDVVTVMRRRWT